MSARLLTLVLEDETAIVLARKRTRRLAELIGFDNQDQTRITTAVSEIARNALEYAGGGRVEFRISGEIQSQRFEIVVIDKGPGVPNLEGVLDGSQRSATGMGIGLTGARRLMDEFDVQSVPGVGTTVSLGKALPRRVPPVTQTALRKIVDAIAQDAPPNPIEEIRRQNQEMVLQLEELQSRQEQLSHLNQELQDTNRGVVALYAELDERADHLRRADELKSQFLSNMSHEFRTPLNSILALSRLLITRMDGPLTPEQDKQVQYIRKAAENLTELVNDLLDLAKVEAGKTVVTPSEFSAEELFGALRGMLRPLLVGDAVALVFNEPTNMPMLVTDEGKVSQILRNFISNAIKFTERGEVRIRASYDADQDSVTFSVSDTGIGIAEQDLEIIFQEFGQVANSMQRRIKGTGLGLPLAKKLAELMRGGVAVKSVLGQGSVFSVTLPRVYHTATEVAEAAPHWEVQTGRVPILVLEDNPADAFAVERILAPSRYQAIGARSIAEARQALDDVRPAAAILDVVLLGDESWRFLIELKQGRKDNIPVLVASSSPDERKAYNLGADEFIPKPVDPEGLVRLLDRFTGHSSVRRVLVVDDEEVSRYLVRQLLPRGTYDVREAATGIEGLAQLREDPPDIVLLDLNMPGMDGFQFLDQLHGNGIIPTIVLTSMTVGRDERNLLQKAAKIISKSDLSAELLVKTIDDLIGDTVETAS